MTELFTTPREAAACPFNYVVGRACTKPNIYHCGY